MDRDAFAQVGLYHTPGRLLPTYSVEKLSSDAGKVENSAFSAQFEARNLWISRSRGISPGEKSGQPGFFNRIDPKRTFALPPTSPPFAMR